MKGAILMMMSRHRISASALASLIALALAVQIASAGPRPELDVTAGLRPTPATRALSSRARADASLRRVGMPASYDQRFELPTLLWAARTNATASQAARPARSTAEVAARRHLARVAGYYRLQALDVAEAPLRYVHDTGRGGVLVAFRQSVDGIEVFRDEMKLLLDRDHELVAVSGYIPSRSLVSRTSRPEFRLPAERALRLALADFTGQLAGAGAIRPSGPAEGGYLLYDVSAAAAALPSGLQPGGPVRVRKTLFHVPDALVPAWLVELMAPDQAYLYVFDAADGRLLFRHDIMVFDSFNYRVWAQTAGDRDPFPDLVGR